MLHFSRWKTIAIVVTCLLGILATVPNFLPQSVLDQLPDFARNRIGLGLDLRGGAHLLTAMDMDELRKDWLVSLVADARKRLLEAKIGSAGIGVVAGNVQVRLARPEDMEAALKALKVMVQPVGGVLRGGSVDNLEIRRQDPDIILITPSEVALNERVSQAMGTAIEIIRRRLDPGGNKEVVVQRQGSDRILVQQPGVEDTSEIKGLISRAAKLTFHLLHPTMGSENLPGGRPPPGYQVLPSNEKDGVSYLVNSVPLVTGEELADAQPGFDSRTNEPIVTFRFNQSGARKFAKVTQENVGRPFAMVLDGKVISAPVIREPILGGTGQISGNFSVQEANNLAILLRSGALPAKLTVVEERVVGASLGQDSIEAGKRAAVIGMLAVAGFMIFAYGQFGVFAVIGAAMHVVLVIAIMSLLGSTLTLPGIAGIVLTIGMAVDANVLIYERVREELRHKKTPLSAIDSGFTLAYRTIIDSQLTTFIAGLVMFLLGSGPVRGFAVTLTLGIMTTVFTAFTVTRLLVVWWIGMQNRRAIPAPL
jgi:protein-export membrane protein SecD